MGDLTRLALELSAQSELSGHDSSTLTQLLDALDSGMRSTSAPVKELFAVSFLENLSQDDPNYRNIATRLGPALAHEMTRLHGGDPW